MIRVRIKQLQPCQLLDFGCQRGEFTITLGNDCTQIIALDSDPEYIQAALHDTRVARSLGHI